MEITIYGRIPSKKNCKMALPIKGRCMVVNSTAYRTWQRETANQLLGKVPMSPVAKCSIEMWIYAPDNRKSDLSNKAESVMDLLVENAVIEDDNWFCVKYLELLFGGVDKGTPRAVVKITPLT